MTALIARNLEFELAESAQRIVAWYAARIWTLWVLLLALPLTVVFVGCATLFGSGNFDAPSSARQSLAAIRDQPAALLVAATTLAAAVILVIVLLHMLAN